MYYKSSTHDPRVATGSSLLAARPQLVFDQPGDLFCFVSKGLDPGLEREKELQPFMVQSLGREARHWLRPWIGEAIFLDLEVFFHITTGADCFLSV